EARDGLPQVVLRPTLGVAVSIGEHRDVHDERRGVLCPPLIEIYETSLNLCEVLTAPAGEYEAPWLGIARARRPTRRLKRTTKFPLGDCVVSVESAGAPTVRDGVDDWGARHGCTRVHTGLLEYLLRVGCGRNVRHANFSTAKVQHRH